MIDRKLAETPSNFIAGHSKVALCFGSLVILDVARCYLWLSSLYINIKIGKIVLNVRLSIDHLYGKLLFTWLSLVMSMMVSFYAVLFPTRCLG